MAQEMIYRPGQKPVVRELTGEEIAEREQVAASIEAEATAQAAEYDARRALGVAIVQRLAVLKADAKAANDPAITLTVMQIRQGIARTDQAIIDLVKLLVRTGVIDVDDATRQLAEQ